MAPAIHLFKRSLIAGVIACVALFLGSAQAQSLTDFARWLDNTQTFTAQFEQTVEGAPKQSGEIWIRFPGDLRWQVNKPSVQKVWVSMKDKSAWIFEPDLRQAVRQPLGGVGGISPAEILLSADPSGTKREGALTRLHQHFNLTTEKSTDGPNTINWIVLTPKNAAPQSGKNEAVAPGAGFQWLKINLNAIGPTQMIVRDSLDREITIRFFSAQKNTPLSAQDFVFIPPAGVDVIDNGGH